MHGRVTINFLINVIAKHPFSSVKKHILISITRLSWRIDCCRFSFHKHQILLDGYPLNTLNIGHLRRHIGVVSQEPSLFTTTISENIAFGNENATQREIEAAAKMANAHDFILRFPKVRRKFSVSFIPNNHWDDEGNYQL